MKNRLIIGLLAVGLAAGVAAERLMPAMWRLFEVTVGATSLKVESDAPLTAVGSGFMYQGKLRDGSNAVNGLYDFQFSLYDAVTGGTQIGGAVQVTQTVTSGIFSVLVDFGAGSFNGDARYLEIAVRPSGGSYTTLAPRQPLTPVPYALLALKTKGYHNVIVVSSDGGDFTSVQAALNSISGNSAGNKFLILVKPGTYGGQVTMKPFVDIEGAGEKITKLTYTGNPALQVGTVIGASNAEIRFLTTENTGAATYAVGMSNNGASPSILHVTATASGGTYNYGVYNSTSSPVMKNVTLTATGGPGNTYGMNNYASAPVMNNVIATASGASGGNYGISNENSSPATMNNVTATASGGSGSYGVYNSQSSPTMNVVTATASAGNFNYGVYNYASSPAMNNLTSTSTGGTPYAVYNYASSPTISNSTLFGGMDAVFSTGAGNVFVNNSRLTGNVWNDSSTVKIGGSYLNGFVGGPAPITCAGNFDENYAFFPNTCP